MSWLTNCWRIRVNGKKKHDDWPIRLRHHCMVIPTVRIPKKIINRLSPIPRRPCHCRWWCPGPHINGETRWERPWMGIWWDQLDLHQLGMAIPTFKHGPRNGKCFDFWSTWKHAKHVQRSDCVLNQVSKSWMTYGIYVIMTFMDIEFPWVPSCSLHVDPSGCPNDAIRDQLWLEPIWIQAVIQGSSSLPVLLLLVIPHNIHKPLVTSSY